MGDIYCKYCGKRLFSHNDIKREELLLEVPGYQCRAYILDDNTDLSGLEHRADEFLVEVWSCCRISVMRSSRGGSPALYAYTDSLVSSDGTGKGQSEVQAAAPQGGLAPHREPGSDLQAQAGGQREQPGGAHAATLLDAEGFERIVLGAGGQPENADKLMVVKFTALWCPPCRIMDNVFRDIRTSGDLPEVEFYEVDSDVDQELTDRYLAPSVPYILFFRGGKKLDASRLSLKAVNGGLAEAMSREDFVAFCREMKKLAN